MHPLVPILFLSLAAQPVRPAPGPPLRAAPSASAPLAAQFRDALAGALALRFVTCDPNPAKDRITAALRRLEAVQPIVVASLGEQAVAGVAGGLIVDPANLYPPGCPPPGELERRTAAFEAAVARLEAAVSR